MMLGEHSAVHFDDLRDPESVVRIIASAIERYGELHGIVNNAAFLTRSTNQKDHT